MDLNIDDLRILLKSFSIDFDKLLSDSELNAFLNSKVDSLTSSGIVIDRNLVDQQDLLYDRLDLFVRLCNKLLELRPLPF